MEQRDLMAEIMGVLLAGGVKEQDLLNTLFNAVDQAGEVAMSTIDKLYDKASERVEVLANMTMKEVLADVMLHRYKIVKDRDFDIEKIDLDEDMKVDGTTLTLTYTSSYDGIKVATFSAISEINPCDDGIEQKITVKPVTLFN